MPTGYRLIGFVDDDPLKWGMAIHGCKVGQLRDVRIEDLLGRSCRGR